MHEDDRRGLRAIDSPDASRTVVRGGDDVSAISIKCGGVDEVRVVTFENDRFPGPFSWPDASVAG
jgi:hypothetical protein